MKQIEANDPEAARHFRNRAMGIRTIKTEVLNAAEKRLKADFDRWYPPFQLRDEYYGLLANRKLMAHLGNGFLTNEEIGYLSTGIAQKGYVDIEDIPAVFFLYLLMYGKREEVYDHIVVDEAQDLSPLQYKILRMYSKAGSMTLVGDIAQGIFAHRGISDWEEVTPR